MSIYLGLTILMGMASIFSYTNQRYFKLPFVIGLFALTTIVSLMIIISHQFFPFPLDKISSFIENMHIESIILDIFLGFLLFAGALHTNWLSLRAQIKTISIFAIFGVLLSTLIISTLLYYCSGLIGIQMEFIYCLIFGALISPTDPIAVLGILTKAGVPKKTEYTIVGESLFNDGIGVVLFVALLSVQKTGDFNLGGFIKLFMQEAIGGLALGLLMGYFLHNILRKINHFETEVIITIFFVMAGYSFCNYLHTSGALAMVVMGLMLGNYKVNESMSDTTQEYVLKFWELLDVILNSLLFILIAFVILMIDFNPKYILLGVISIFIILLSRAIIVYFPHYTFPKLLNLSSHDAKIITWGGLRGGLSIALVLSLSNSQAKEILLVCTYICVLFSIIVQGLTVGRVASSNN